MKKVLIVTYYWPPAGGPGVQRVLKFAKYLPDFGWQPVILTVKNGVYPAIDSSLLSEVDSTTKVFYSKNPEPDKLYRTFTKNPGNTPISVLASDSSSWKKKLAHKIRFNYFIPDAKKYWRSFGFKRGRKIIQEEKPDIIFSSSPPPTTHLIAMDLANWGNLPWIADFRDPWSKIHYYAEGRSERAQQKDQKLEQSVTERCNDLVCVSEKFADLLELRDKKKLTIIHNGYDAQDFKSTYNKSNKFRITYVGGLTINRFYPHFFSAIQKLIIYKKIESAKIEISLAGSINPEIKDELETIFNELNVLKFYDYLPHLQATELMQNSDLLLLFNEKVANYKGHLPGKLFEYLASGAQILGIGETKGEASDILNKCNAGKIIDESTDPSKFLLAHYQNWINGQKTKSNLEVIEKFNRKSLTKKLAQLFDEKLAT